MAVEKVKVLWILTQTSCFGGPCTAAYQSDDEIPISCPYKAVSAKQSRFLNVCIECANVIDQQERETQQQIPCYKNG